MHVDGRLIASFVAAVILVFWLNKPHDPDGYA